MSRKKGGPGSDSGASTSISTPPPSGSTRMLPPGGDAVSLDPDLWVALAALDRVLGTDQVTVIDVARRTSEAKVKDARRAIEEQRYVQDVLGITPRHLPEGPCPGCSWCDPPPVCTCQGRCVCGALTEEERRAREWSP